MRKIKDAKWVVGIQVGLILLNGKSELNYEMLNYSDVSVMILILQPSI